MPGKMTSVFGLYTTADGVERAGDTLVSSGFSNADISVLLPTNIGAQLRSRSILLSVQCDTSDKISRAKDILERTMALDGSFTRAASADARVFDRALQRVAVAR